MLKAASIARGGELFVLDMGQPVKIRELAERMIQLYAPHDGRKVEIVYVGLRPGEKLYEELLLAGEGIAKTESEKIFVAKARAGGQAHAGRHAGPPEALPGRGRRYAGLPA